MHPAVGGKRQKIIWIEHIASMAAIGIAPVFSLVHAFGGNGERDSRWMSAYTCARWDAGYMTTIIALVPNLR